MVKILRVHMQKPWFMLSFLKTQIDLHTLINDTSYWGLKVHMCAEKEGLGTKLGQMQHKINYLFLQPASDPP